MIITGMAHFESVCKNKLVEWYNPIRQHKSWAERRSAYYAEECLCGLGVQDVAELQGVVINDR